MDFDQNTSQRDALRKLHFYKELNNSVALSRREVAEKMNLRVRDQSSTFPIPKNFDSWVKYIDDTTGLAVKDSRSSEIQARNNAAIDPFRPLDPSAETADSTVRRYIRPIEFTLFCDLCPETVDQARAMIPSLDDTISRLHTGAFNSDAVESDREAANDLMRVIQDCCDRAKAAY